MAGASFVQSSFLGGEYSDLMQGRVDRPEYRTALNVCINYLPTETGGLVRRPGFMNAGFTRAGANGRVIKFDFDQSSSYTMEFTDSHLRFRSGLSIANNREVSGIIGVSSANPAVVEVGGALSWATGDEAYFTNLGTTAPLLQNRVLTLTRIDSTHYSLADSVTGDAIDGAALGSVGTGPIISKVLDIATPYVGGGWASLRSVQTEKTAFLLTPGIKPYVLQVTTVPSPGNFAIFSFDAVVFLDGPYLDPDKSGITLLPSVAGGAGTLTASDDLFVSTDVGRQVRLLAEPPQWLPAPQAFAINDAVRDLGVYYGCISALPSGSNSRPSQDPSHWTIAPQNSRWSWGTITAYNSSTSVDFEFADGTFYLAYNPSAIPAAVTWRLGLYSDTTGWPTCGTYSEGRLWLSGAIANRIDASAANGIDGKTVNFAPTGNGLDHDDVGATGAVSASNAISYVFNAPDTNPILWMTPDLQGIICGTKAGEWLVVAPTSGPLTPFNIAARRVTKIGCANVEPVHTEHTTVFVQKFLRKIMEYFADVFSGKFTAPHLTFTAKHLTEGNIQEIAYQQELAPIVWARVNGNLRGCTYKRETLMTSQGPTAAGWHRHVLGSGRTVESITVGPSVGGTTDSLTMVTKETSTGHNHVEVMSDILDEGSALTDAAYLDDAIAPSSTTEAAPSGGMPYGGLVLNGLWHLNGKTVAAWLGGLDCGDYTVAAGSITVPYGDGVSAGTGAGLFTSDYVATFSGNMPMLVGFTYTSDGQIVRPNSRDESGARNGPAFGKLRRNHNVVALLEGTQGISFGTNFAKLYPALFRTANGSNYLVSQQFSGVYRASLTDDYSFDGMICWRVTRPYISNLAAIGGLIETQDA